MPPSRPAARASAQHRRAAADPYALSPDRVAEPGLGGERDLLSARYDGGLRMWTGPFAMAGINTRVVRCSNALQGWAYGRRFRYREVTRFGAGPARRRPQRARARASAPAGQAFHRRDDRARLPLRVGRVLLSSFPGWSATTPGMRLGGVSFRQADPGAGLPVKLNTGGCDQSPGLVKSTAPPENFAPPKSTLPSENSAGVTST